MCLLSVILLAQNLMPEVFRSATNSNFGLTEILIAFLGRVRFSPPVGSSPASPIAQTIILLHISHTTVFHLNIRQAPG
jgi:hypothetical protein